MKKLLGKGNIAIMLVAAMLMTTACSADQTKETEAETETEQQTVVATETVAETEAETEIDEHEAARMQAENIVASMTLDEKIGQMLMPCARSWSDDGENYYDLTVLNDTLAQAISDYNLSGLCLFSENSESTEQLVQLTSDLQTAASESSSGIPLLLSIDQEGGYVTRLYNGTSMIGNMALAATGDSQNAETSAEVISSELQAVGVNVDFAPDSDINDNPENPIIGIRSFSDDADTVAEYAGAYIEGLHENNICSCIKHFPGHGNTATDSHTGLPLVDKSLEELEEEELVPFAALADETDMIMTAHIQFPQIETETYTSISTGESVNLPATMSKTIITGILREELGYDGVVVTDSFEMSAIADNFALNDAVKAAINADVDMILMPFDLNSASKIEKLGTLVSDIEDMVSDGEIEESQIDDSVVRILTLKIERGIMTVTDENGSVSISVPESSVSGDVSSALSIVGSKEHHDTEWELAEKAITLYQDSNDTYSYGISSDEDVLYLCPYSSEKQSMDLALEKLSEEGYDTDNLNITTVCYYDCSVYDIMDYIDYADRVILVSDCSSLSNLDTDYNSLAAFCQDVIAETHDQGKEVDLISAELPYDAVFYDDADVILLAYNPVGVREMPESYDGYTRCYGANLSAALVSLISGRELTGTCPVDLDNIDF